VVLYVINACPLVTKSFSWYFATETFNERLCWSTDGSWKLDLIDALEDDIVRLHGIG
jgi:hypothetical protein